MSASQAESREFESRLPLSKAKNAFSGLNNMALDRLLREKTHDGANVDCDALLRHIELFSLYCKSKNYSPKTIDTYEKFLGYFVEFCRSRNVRTVEQIDMLVLMKYIEHCMARVKPITVHDYYRVVKRWLNWLVVMEIIPENPGDKIGQIKYPSKIIQAFNDGHIRDMLTVCNDGSKNGIRNQAIILMLLDTGLRLNECASLELKDVDIHQEAITVLGKGGKQRRVRFGKQAQKALLKYLPKRKDDLPNLWVTEEGQPLQKEGIQMIIRRIKDRAGITDVRCSAHTFRHTFAINYLRNGGDVFTLQYILGHSALDMTQKYVASLKSEDAMNGHKKWSPVDNMKLRF